MKTLTNFPNFLQEVKSEKIGTFYDKNVAKEVQRLFSLGCIPNILGTTESRIVEANGEFILYARVKGKILS